MTQGDIIKFLEKNPDRWFSTKYLTEKFKVKSVVTNIRRLEKHDEVDLLELNLDGRIKFIVRHKKEGRIVSLGS